MRPAGVLSSPPLLDLLREPEARDFERAFLPDLRDAERAFLPEPRDAERAFLPPLWLR